MRNRLSTLILTVAIAAMAAMPALSEIMFGAELSGANEVPPNLSGGSGVAHLTLNDAMTEIAYHIEFEDLMAPETAAHFHNAAPGQNGSVLFGLPLGSPKEGIWPVGPFEVGELLAGRVYVNVHSSQFPGGEIRGDLREIVTPAETATLSAIKALY